VRQRVGPITKVVGKIRYATLSGFNVSWSSGRPCAHRN
jgi:hypothetical protein